jgi:uncharacterized protein YdcH (DUF465 family)
MLPPERSARGPGKGPVIGKVVNQRVVERIRSLLARFSEDEETVRRLAATDAHFDALCDEYREVIERLDGLEMEVKRLKERRTMLEEDLLTRIEGYQPQ